MPTPLSDLNTLVGIATLAVGVLVAEEVLSFVVRRAAKTANAGPTVLRDIKTSLRLVALILVLSNVLNLAGLSSLFTTLTISGILAIAASLALQTTLSNVISGLFLFSDGAIRLGDTIEYGSTKGKIVRIGLRNTWIRSEAGHLVLVSNSSLSGGPLINHTATPRLSKKYAFE
jgi:small-conductance mechanosensitive channel